jgi:hypothetical protein
MKTSVAVALVGLAISFALPTLAQQTSTSSSPASPATAQQGDTVDPQVAEQVRALASKYDQAFNQKRRYSPWRALFGGRGFLWTAREI